MLVINNKVRCPEEKYNVYYKFIIFPLTLNGEVKFLTVAKVLQYYDVILGEWLDIEYVDTEYRE